MNPTKRSTWDLYEDEDTMTLMTLGTLMVFLDRVSSDTPIRTDNGYFLTTPAEFFHSKESYWDSGDVSFELAEKKTSWNGAFETVGDLYNYLQKHLYHGEFNLDDEMDCANPISDKRLWVTENGKCEGQGLLNVEVEEGFFIITVATV